jgi:hypothetical protein
VSFVHLSSPPGAVEMAQDSRAPTVKVSTYGWVALPGGKDLSRWHVPRKDHSRSPMAPSSRTLFRGSSDKAPALTHLTHEVRRSSVGSWMGLLAATTLGVPGASTLRAEVRADMALSEGRPYRLVVQSYDESLAGDVPPGHAKPRASTQRPITAVELKRGVRVDLLELGQAGDTSDGAQGRPRSIDDAARGNLAKAMVLAWVEEGRADLEFDGRRARPMPGSFVGAARRERTQGKVRIDVKPA